MKLNKFAGIIIIALCVSFVSAGQAWSSVEINESNFPDETFRNFVRNFDGNSDGTLSDEEIAGVNKDINVYDKNITSLKGIEYFTALEMLQCSYNQLTELDVSKNTALKDLACYSNKLTELDVSKNTALERLWCDDNRLMALDLSNNTQIRVLDIGNHNISPFLVSKDQDGNYIIDLKDYMSSDQLSNVSVSNVEGAAYSPSTGIITISPDIYYSEDGIIKYTYDTGKGNLNVNISGLTTSFSKPEIISDSSSSSLPDAVYYELYDDYLFIQCSGAWPMDFNIISGEIPQGLVFQGLGGNKREYIIDDNGDKNGCVFISGIPTQAGTFKFTIQSSNFFGAVSKDFTLVMQEDQHNPPSISPDLVPGANIDFNQKCSLQVKVSEGKRPITFSISEGKLPDALSVDTEYGTIVGTPEESGKFTFTMKAVNEEGEDTQQFTLIVNDPNLSIITPSDLLAIVNQEYTLTLEASGDTPITWELYKDTSLPEWLNLSNGVLSGTPTETGTFKFALTAQNSNSSKVRQEFTLIVSKGVYITTDSNLPDVSVGNNYSQQLEATAEYPIKVETRKKIFIA